MMIIIVIIELFILVCYSNNNEENLFEHLHQVPACPPSSRDVSHFNLSTTIITISVHFPILPYPFSNLLVIWLLPIIIPASEMLERLLNR